MLSSTGCGPEERTPTMQPSLTLPRYGDYQLLLNIIYIIYVRNIVTFVLFQIGDLIGTSLLALAFLILENIGDTSLVNLQEAHDHSLSHNISHFVNHTDILEL